MSVRCENVSCEMFDREELGNCSEFQELTEKCCNDYRGTNDGVWINIMHEAPAMGQKVLLFSNGVVQNEIYTLDAEDVSDYSPMVYFWARDELEDCPNIKETDYWMNLPNPPGI